MHKKITTKYCENVSGSTVKINISSNYDIRIWKIIFI